MIVLETEKKIGWKAVTVTSSPWIKVGCNKWSTGTFLIWDNLKYLSLGQITGANFNPDIFKLQTEGKLVINMPPIKTPLIYRQFITLFLLLFILLFSCCRNSFKLCCKLWEKRDYKMLQLSFNDIKSMFATRWMLT